MSINEWANIFSYLLEAGLSYAPRTEGEVEERLNAYYNFLSDYNSDEVKCSVFFWIANEDIFPKIKDIIERVELNRLGIYDIRLYLYELKETKEKISRNYSKKIKSSDKKRELIREKNEVLDNYPNKRINKLLSAYGGAENIDDIIKYSINDFKKSLKKQIVHKITQKKQKLLEEK